MKVNIRPGSSQILYYMLNYLYPQADISIKMVYFAITGMMEMICLCIIYAYF